MTTTAAPEKIPVTCSVTGLTVMTKQRLDGNPAVPKGWKLINDKLVSPKGWQPLYVTKAAVLPVVSAIVGYGDDWSQVNRTEGRKALNKALVADSGACARLLNWAMVEYAKSDNAPLEDAGDGKFKLPKWSAAEVPLYHEARRLFPALNSQSLSSLLNEAGQKYSRERFNRRIRQSISLPSYRHGVPIPIPKKDYRLVVDPVQKTIKFKFLLHGTRFTLQFRTTPDRKHHSTFRQAELLRNIVLKEEGQLGAAKIWYSKDQDNRFSIKVGISLYAPVQKAEREDRVMIVKTQPDRLLTAFVEGRGQPWNLNDDQVRRRVMAHKAQLLRLSEDDKFERRSGHKRFNTTPQEYRERLARKYDNCMRDYTNKVSAMLAGLAARNKCCLIKFDYSDTSWCPELRWFDIVTKLTYKAKQLGIGVEVTSSGDQEPDAEQEALKGLEASGDSA